MLTYVRKQRAWLFPALLAVFLILATIFRFSGSSIGMFNSYLYGTTDNSNLIANEPRPIRSDEWEVVTPLTISQVTNHFPRINTDNGEGSDASVVLDVPYKDWSQFFKPQNWVFFILPLEYAFAFKWWLLGVLLMLSCYVFFLTLLPKKYLLASLASVFLFLSPFVHWWYQTITIAPLFYALFILAISLRLLDNNSVNKRLLMTCLLTYCMSCFALVLYLPFVIPCLIVAAAVLIGQWTNLYRVEGVKKKKEVISRAIPIMIAGIISCIVLGIFVSTRISTIKTISNTVYPGNRTEPSGNFKLTHLLNGTFNGQLQSDAKSKFLDTNQSESSNFILIFPFLIPSILYVMWKKRKEKQFLDLRFIFLLIIIILFLFKLFVSKAGFIFSITHLNRIPNTRLLIGFGLINIVVLGLTMQILDGLKKPIQVYIASTSGLICSLTTILVGLAIRHAHPGYIQSIPKIVVVSALLGAAVTLLLRRRYSISLALLVCLGFLSVFRINPVYRGLSPIVGSDLSAKLQLIGDSKGAWVTSDKAAPLENVTLANGLKSLSGVYAYPQLSLWESLKQTPADQDIYNRYAHVFFSIESVDENTAGAYLDPPALDAFRVHADPCKPYLKSRHVTFVISGEDLSNLTCLKKVDELIYPAITLEIYEIR